MAGTSQAAPHVAVATAVPAAAPADVQEALVSSSKVVADPLSGFSTPRIDVLAAIATLSAKLS